MHLLASRHCFNEPTMTTTPKTLTYIHVKTLTLFCLSLLQRRPQSCCLLILRSIHVVFGGLGVPLCTLIRLVKIFLVLVFSIHQNPSKPFLLPFTTKHKLYSIMPSAFYSFDKLQPLHIFLANNNLKYLLVYIHPL